MKACYRDRVSFSSCRGQCVVTSETVVVIGYSCINALQCAQYLAAYSYTVFTYHTSNKTCPWSQQARTSAVEVSFHSRNTSYTSYTPPLTPVRFKLPISSVDSLSYKCDRTENDYNDEYRGRLSINMAYIGHTGRMNRDKVSQVLLW